MTQFIFLDNEGPVSIGDLEYEIDINLSFGASALIYGLTGVSTVAIPEQVGAQETVVIYVTGSVYAAGSLLAPGPNASIPIESDGNLVTDTGQVIIDDLFEEVSAA